jgi:factor associated with neutral sphingomyelinase activation
LKKKKLLITGSWDCSLKSFECSENSVNENSEETIFDYDAQITSVAASEDEKYIAVGDVDGRVFIIETDDWS